MIPNPNPITATFAGMWIQSAHLAPQDDGTIKASARMTPYDPVTKVLLATGAKNVRVTIPQELATSIKTELTRLSDTDRTIKNVFVGALDPARPVVVRVEFVEGQHHIIRDAYALAATDSAFALVFQAAMLSIAA